MFVCVCAFILTAAESSRGAIYLLVKVDCQTKLDEHIENGNSTLGRETSNDK